MVVWRKGRVFRVDTGGVICSVPAVRGGFGRPGRVCRRVAALSLAAGDVVLVATLVDHARRRACRFGPAAGGCTGGLVVGSAGPSAAGCSNGVR